LDCHNLLNVYYRDIIAIMGDRIKIFYGRRGATELALFRVPRYAHEIGVRTRRDGSLVIRNEKKTKRRYTAELPLRKGKGGVCQYGETLTPGGTLVFRFQVPQNNPALKI